MLVAFHALKQGLWESRVVFAERLFRNLSANTTEIPKDPFHALKQFLWIVV